MHGHSTAAAGHPVRYSLVQLCVSALMLASAAAAQDSVLEAQQVLRVANAAYGDGDLKGFVSELEKALELNPASLATRYNLACGYARIGNTERALELLTDLVTARADFGMADDPDLESLRDQPEFHKLLAALEQNLAPVAASRHVLTVDELGLIPEGIAIDPATGRIFFGSMRNGGIYVVHDKRWLSRFAGIDDRPGFSAIGLAVDSERQTLWSVGTATRMAAGFDANGEVRTGLFGFDLRSGEPTVQYLADASVEGFNDITVAPNGDLYLSGSVLSVIPAGSTSIQPLDTSIKLVGTNGVAVPGDGRVLFASSYPVGIARVDLTTGATQFLDVPKGATLYGIDGLYEYRGELVAIQNGTQPWRLIRLALNADRSAVIDIRYIEFANAALTATTGAITGDEIHYIGQGPAPDPAPGHVPPALVPLFGKTVIMAAPLE